MDVIWECYDEVFFVVFLELVVKDMFGVKFYFFNVVGLVEVWFVVVEVWYFWCVVFFDDKWLVLVLGLVRVWGFVLVGGC